MKRGNSVSILLLLAIVIMSTGTIIAPHEGDISDDFDKVPYEDEGECIGDDCEKPVSSDDKDKVDSSRGSDKVCCQYPGPADEAMYEWRVESDCQVVDNPFSDRIVDDDFCEDKSKLGECRDRCKKSYDDEESRSKCISGCKSDHGFGDFEDDPDYMCEDMTQDDCELAEDCESIWEGPDCEGEDCPAVVFWEGCRYEGDEFFEDYKDEKLKQNAGTTPDSAFYFIDKFFDKFGDELKVKEERIAEIKAMIEAGDIESAKIALEDYMELAEELEHEIDPERKEEAKRSAAAIRAVMKDIRDQLPPRERGRFVSEVMKKEHSIATTAEISGKIKELCVQLAELDPLEYSKMCRTDDDAPKWKRDLDADLSAEQEKTAREFVDIMKSCFKTSGQDCRCDDIPFYDFSVACSKAAPLATACDIEGDEIACDELDNLDMPDLPEWLEPIWEDLEDGMMEAQYAMHMPPECVEAGITEPKECGKIMIKEHAPLECKAALLESGCDKEFECRKICDKIMMEQHAPECAKEGITDPEECRDFMDNFRGPGGPMMSGGPGFGPDCGRIEDAMERLDCYDNKGNQMGERYGPMDGEMPEGEITWQCKENRIHWPPDCERFMREELPMIEQQQMEEGDLRRENEEDWRVKEKECADSCDLQNGWWDFRDGECVCYTDERSGESKPGEYGSDDSDEGDDYSTGPTCDDCQSQCPGASRTGCGPNGCECYYENDEPQYGPGEGPGEPGDYYEEPPPTTTEPPPSEQEPQEPAPSEPAPTDNTGDGTTSASITGNVFLDYMN